MVGAAKHAATICYEMRFAAGKNEEEKKRSCCEVGKDA